MEILWAKDAGRYVYRLYSDGHPVGHWGPAIAFTAENARQFAPPIFNYVTWVKAGELIYSVN